ncbi:cytochrome C biogenesis protein CcsA [Terasakiispira papahanaumokuakeensis]|uniref:Cytochrome C biogenesis protein CcsA n=1 Tax=Terasakiispira papahanaumokuakeensis TaxID=197479 RepID=A0A1E2VDK5_9GAMM|nr:cytochrome-c peroxidase [Terasakiispira papahanaumokuakeensis]ODC05057.1 cytochrome C biogenesis protein CcsA [Terasakiispira papahanaumokuakeensis]
MNLTQSLVTGVLFSLCLPAWADRATDEPITPISPAQVSNPELVELGKQLYFDPRLSRSGFISCNSCHNLSMGGTDNLPTSIGDHWQQGPINSPTVLNASMNLAQFWDGRAADLKAQAGGPIENPKEMASNHTLAVEVLRSIPEYRASFKARFGNEAITIDQVTTAIAAFEETLVTPNARFDQWLKGDDDALTEQEQSGYALFKEIGCTACHYGPAIGGKSFQKMGLIEAYQTNNPAQGRAGVTGKDADRFMFKVPTLRNIALTYPYFHDGAYWNLSEAVDVMARLQLGRQLNDDENARIVAFLKTLTGQQPDFKLPILPPSTPETPRPEPFPEN